MTGFKSEVDNIRRVSQYTVIYSIYWPRISIWNVKPPHYFDMFNLLNQESFCLAVDQLIAFCQTHEICKTPFNPSHINCLSIFFLAVETYVFLCLWGKFGITVDKVRTTHPLNHISYFFMQKQQDGYKGWFGKRSFYSCKSTAIAVYFLTMRHQDLFITFNMI